MLCKTTIARPCSEADISTLRMLFPKLDHCEAAAVLREQGCVEKAASVLVDVEVSDGVPTESDDYHSDGGSFAAKKQSFEIHDLPSFLRCPRCFSPDIVMEDQTGTVVCIECHHHFTRDKAKRGSVKAAGGGAIGAPQPRKLAKREEKRKRREQQQQQKQQEEEEGEDDDEEEEGEEGAAALGSLPGPVLRKLYQARALKAQNPTLRLVVSHAGSPKEKRVITVPKEGGFTSLLKQARAKFRLRKPLKGVRLLPEGSPVARLDHLENGVEVLVTHTSEFPKSPKSPRHTAAAPPLGPPPMGCKQHKEEEEEAAEDAGAKNDDNAPSPALASAGA